MHRFFRSAFLLQLAVNLCIPQRGLAQELPGAVHHVPEANAIINSWTDIMDPDDGVIGNPAGSKTLVVVLDRAAPFGESMVPILIAMVATDQSLRVVIKELPLLSEDSVSVATMAYAAHRLGPEKTLAFEAALSRNPEATVGDAKKIALSLGADLNDKTQTRAMVYLRRTRAIMTSLGLASTPAFFSPHHSVIGLRGIDDLRRLVASEQGG